jgi:Zn-dependent peptidase ImmA (M78 family)
MKTNPKADENVFATVRALVPRRPLNYYESLRIAELQANRLLELARIVGPRVPSEVVSELPRITVRYETDIPTAGASYWENDRWIIELRREEPESRQRFSQMHELKHILDHPYARIVYARLDHDTVERVANHFAACVLMPNRWIKSEWARSGHNIPVLARRLGVSAHALRYRAWYLGLSAPSARRTLAGSELTFDSSRDDRTVDEFAA